MPAKSFKELIAYVRANPNKINYASSTVGSNGHLSGLLLNAAAGIDMQHVPYKGTAQAVLDVLGGRIPVYVSSTSTVIPHIKSGKLRALAVTGAHRSSVMGLTRAGYQGQRLETGVTVRTHNGLTLGQEIRYPLMTVMTGVIAAD